MGSDDKTVDQVVGPKVFVSYRRSDTEDVAGQLSSLLKRDLGSRNVYRDRESMILGQPWREALSDAMRDADVALFLVGPGWEGETETDRRIDRPDDVVRREVAEALSAEVRANPLPLLVDRSAPPEDLPDDVKDLFDQPHFVSMDRDEVTSESSAGYQSILVGVWAALARLVPRGVIILGESTKMVELDSLVQELAEAGVVESQSLSRFASGVYIASWRDVKKLKSDFPDLIVQSAGDPSEELKARLAAYATLSVGATVAVTGAGAAALVAVGPSLGFGGSGGATLAHATSAQLATTGATASSASASGIKASGGGWWSSLPLAPKLVAGTAALAAVGGGLAIWALGGPGYSEPFNLVAAEDGQIAVTFEGNELVTAPIEPDADITTWPNPTNGEVVVDAGNLAIVEPSQLLIGPIGGDLTAYDIDPFVTELTLAADGKTVAYRSGEGVVIVDLVSGDRREVAVDVERFGVPYSLEFSPDQTKLSMAASSGADVSFLVADVTTGEITLALPVSSDLGSGPPVWSPDSERLAFIGSTVAINPNVLNIVTVATGDIVGWEIGGLALRPSWSPEGDRIVFTDGDGNGWGACVIVLDDGSTTCFTEPFNLWGTTWSWADDLLIGSVISCGFEACRDDDVGVWALDADDGSAFHVFPVGASN